MFYPQDVHRISTGCGKPVENLWITWGGGGEGLMISIAVAT